MQSLLYKKNYSVLIPVLFLLIGISFWVGHHYFTTDGVLPAPYVEFNQSMKFNDFKQIADRSDFSYAYNFFKQIYEKNSFQKLQPQKALIIPQIIHIMWLGKKLPEEYRPYVISWRKFHPNWTILFWTDNPINYDQGTKVVHTFDQLAQCLASVKGGESMVINTDQLQFENRAFYDRAQNYGEKSDILKWEIVYRFGGVYVDTDFECLRPLDVFHHTYDFYTGIQPLDTNMVQLGAALYGAIPHHPILEACVKNIKNNQEIKQIIVKTGPIHFTKMFLALAGTTGLKDIAMPASYFYPCGYEQKGLPQKEWRQPESYAIHHWAGSWLKPEAFVRS
jgi:mannosyltransferase OCH1-like enzyme